MSRFKHLFSWQLWNQTIPFGQSASIFVFLAPIISLLAIPTQITVDGIFYVASAKAIFSPDFADFYIWYREPGYPLFLKAIHLLGNSALYVQAAQALCMGLSVWMLLYAFRRSLGFHNVTRFQVGLALLFMFNPMFFSYSGNFLQQALFCFFLASFAVFVEWSRKLPRKVNDILLVGLTLGLYVTAILTSIGWLYLSLFPMLLIWVNIVRRRFLNPRLSQENRSRFVARGLSVVSIALLLISSYGLGRATYAGWETF